MAAVPSISSAPAQSRFDREEAVPFLECAEPSDFAPEEYQSYRRLTQVPVTPPRMARFQSVTPDTDSNDKTDGDRWLLGALALGGGYLIGGPLGLGVGALLLAGCGGDEPTSWRQVSTGWLHTCGIKTDNTVACWGNNNDGQSSPPAGVFTQVTAGRLHSCGVRTGGRVTCWGNNEYNQTASPEGIFTQVDTRADGTCGVKTDGSVECWGEAYLLGLYTPPSGTFVQVSSGLNHGCGVEPLSAGETTTPANPDPHRDCLFKSVRATGTPVA